MAADQVSKSASLTRWCQIIAWSLSTLVAVLAILAWGHDYAWHLFPVNIYIWFPLLGLVAFSVMWSHYVIGAVRDLMHIKSSALKHYFSATGWVVLILICLHPGLLIYQRFRDGFGLPPGSYEHYVRPGLGWVTLLGTASLLVFLAYELRRVFSNKHWWHFVPEAGDVAMLAIFYHSLRLGSQLSHDGWFYIVWWFYGITLTLIIGRSYIIKYILKPSKNPA